MKGMFKRALAGVAAAALAVTGFALGAGAANAAPANQTITITAGNNGGEVAGHTFTYVQIASYVDGDKDQIVTNPDVIEQVRTAVRNTYTDVDDVTIPNNFNNIDPLVWAQGVSGKAMGDNSKFPWTSDALSRKFADELVTAGLPGTVSEPAGATSGSVIAEDEATSVSINGLDGGLFLITDDATNGLPMLVGTLNNELKQDGEIVVKNQNAPSAPTKTRVNENGDPVESKTVTEGETLHFAIKGSVPSTTGLETASYTFSDYADEGLTIDLTSIALSAGNTGEFKQFVKGDDYTVNPDQDEIAGTGVDADKATFTVTLTKAGLDKIQQYAGQALTLTYDAKVTDADQPLSNKATVTTDGDPSDPDIEHLSSTPVEFTKVGEKGAALTGVKFSIAVAEDHVNDTPAIPQGYQKTATSDNGKVRFEGLADGYYTITEGTPLEGYLNTGLSFTVKIKTTWNEEGTEVVSRSVTVVDESESHLPFQADYELVTTDKEGKITNITQLPLTGAAGTMLFTVLGLLIAGAGALVYMKSRSVKHALRG